MTLDPPAGVFPESFLFLVSVSADPLSGDLFGVMQDSLSYFLARLDLDAIDMFGDLEVEIVGVLGTSSDVHAGAPFGFTLGGIAFKPDTGELYGVGVELDAGTSNPSLFTIQTSPGTISLTTKIGTGDDTVSFPRGLTFDASGMPLFVSGRRRLSDGTTVPTLITFNLTTGDDTIAGDITGLDGTVRGLASTIELPGLPPRPPTITSFSPVGGNASILVRIEGSGFTANEQPNVTAVGFGPSAPRILAIGDPIVLSDTAFRIAAPDAPTGPIEVTNSEGSAVSTDAFIRSELSIIDTEISQGLASYLFPIVGKDTIVRLFTASSESTATTPIPVTFESASLTITKPGGQTATIPATFYTRIFSNPASAINISERHNINFYISGDELDVEGTYTFDYDVRGSAAAGSPLLAGGSLTSDLQPTVRQVRQLIVIGGVDPNNTFIGPDQPSLDNFPVVLDEFSRTCPTPNGVSVLGDDTSTGTRFAIAPKAVSLGDTMGQVVLGDVWDPVARSVEPLLDAFNEENDDEARTVAVFVGDEIRGSGAFGLAELGGDLSIVVIDDGNRSADAPLQEWAHNFGLVSSGPNQDPDSLAHSVNNRFPSGASATDARAFDLPGRRALGARPHSIMFPSRTVDHTNGNIFFEDFEFNTLAFFQPVFNVGLAFVTVAAIRDDGTAEILQSYETLSGRAATPLDPTSDLSIAFLDASGATLADDPITLSFLRSGSGEDGLTVGDVVIVSIIRPLPPDTVEVQLRLAGNSMAAVSRSASPPTVAIVSPAGGEDFGLDGAATIAWTASDPDGDDLEFSVLYSTDGATWLPIAAAIDSTSVDWNVSLAAGSDVGRLRVVASDGFHRVSVDSATFRVAPKPPVVTIIRPRPDQIFLEHDSIVLTAGIFDLEHGTGAASIAWSSDVAGPLGSARQVVLPTGTLAPGAHAITLAVTDDEVVRRVQRIG